MFPVNSDSQGIEMHSLKERFLTVNQVASMLGWSRQQVLYRIRSGAIPAKNLSAGKRPTYLVDRDALESEWSKSQHSKDAGDSQAKVTRHRRERIDANVTKVFS
jgi:hypothetical protein